MSKNWITRTAERLSLFSAATVYAGRTSRPARLRDMSPQGAMVESTLVPEVGSFITIRRGGLRASGRVVWTRDNRFGLSFSCPAQVSDWIVSPHRMQRIADLVLEAWSRRSIGSRKCKSGINQVTLIYASKSPRLLG